MISADGALHWRVFKQIKYEMKMMKALKALKALMLFPLFEESFLAKALRRRCDLTDLTTCAFLFGTNISSKFLCFQVPRFVELRLVGPSEVQPCFASVHVWGQ